MSEERISSIQKKDIKALVHSLTIAEMHAADRLLTNDDERYFAFVGSPNDKSLHIFTLKGDHEADRFAYSVRQFLTNFGMVPWWTVTTTAIDETQLRLGRMPSGIWGPYEGVTGRGMSGEGAALYSAFGSAGFCIHTNRIEALLQITDKSPGAISLIFGPKDRHAECK